MNEGIGKFFDSWMPFILLMAIFVTCMVSFFMTGGLHIALQGIVVGIVFIMALHYIPNKKEKFIFDKEKGK
jgi:hypothetical protein